MRNNLEKQIAFSKTRDAFKLFTKIRKDYLAKHPIFIKCINCLKKTKVNPRAVMKTGIRKKTYCSGACRIAAFRKRHGL